MLLEIYQINKFTIPKCLENEYISLNGNESLNQQKNLLSRKKRIS